MKTFAFLAIAVALSTVGMHAQFGTPLPERQSLAIHKTFMPLYPRSLLETGVNRGSVRIVLDVDHQGLLTEWLVVGYSHREFAEAVESAVRRWHFDPMRVRGETVASQVELHFDFSTKGAVVSQIGSAVPPGNLIPGILQSGGSWPGRLDQLDRGPVPLVTVEPSYGFDLRDKGVKGAAIVEFYIDRNGSVRMPAVIESDFMELGALALQAVEQWSFEPATAKGEPILVKARQVFHFDGEEL